MKIRTKVILYLTIVVVILTGVLLRVKPSNIVNRYGMEKNGRLEALSTWTYVGWISSDLPLASTVEGERIVERVLNFDECVSKTFLVGHSRLDVFVTFWRPGKMHPNAVDAHTPDICWTIAGWNCRQKSKVSMANTGGHLEAFLENRIFEQANGKKEYVVFAHFYGEKIFDNGGRGNGKIPNPFLWLRDSLSLELGHSKGQIFIRVSSNMPIEDWKDDAGWKSLMNMLEETIRTNA